MAKDPREYGYEGEMVMSQLKGIMNHAKQMHDMLKPDTDLPEWVQSKVTLAYDYMQTAADYMATEMNEEVTHSVHVKTYDSHGEKQMNSPEFKKHIEAHGGKLDYASDKGAAFKFASHSHAAAFHRGVQSKFKELDSEHDMHEGMQIAELSKGTLKSYINKADARTMHRTIDNPKAHKKAQNRTFGIEKAVKKVNEEGEGGPVNVAANVANPDNKKLCTKPMKRFKSFKAK
jgi:hypothetical protein